MTYQGGMYISLDYGMIDGASFEGELCYKACQVEHICLHARARRQTIRLYGQCNQMQTHSPSQPRIDWTSRKESVSSSDGTAGITLLTRIDETEGERERENKGNLE